MVRHDAVPADAHRRTLPRLGEEVEESLVVRIFVKHGGAGVAAIDHVVAETGGRTAGRARHGPTLCDGAADVKKEE